MMMIESRVVEELFSARKECEQETTELHNNIEQNKKKKKRCRRLQARSPSPSPTPSHSPSHSPSLIETNIEQASEEDRVRRLLARRRVLIPLPRIPKSDVRRSYAAMFANVYNSADWHYMTQYLSLLFRPNLKFTFQSTLPLTTAQVNEAMMESMPLPSALDMLGNLLAIESIPPQFMEGFFSQFFPIRDTTSSKTTSPGSSLSQPTMQQCLINGLDGVSAFWFDRMHDAPDLVFTPGPSQVKVRSDGTGAVKFLFTISGHRELTLPCDCDCESVVPGELMKSVSSYFCPFQDELVPIEENVHLIVPRAKIHTARSPPAIGTKSMMMPFALGGIINLHLDEDSHIYQMEMRCDLLK